MDGSDAVFPFMLCLLSPFGVFLLWLIVQSWLPRNKITHIKSYLPLQERERLDVIEQVVGEIDDSI